MRIKDKLKLILCLPINKIRQIIYRKPKVMTDEQTLDYICAKKCSVARYGDGELELMIGIDIKFQESNKRLSKRLKEIARLNGYNNCLVCIPNVFSNKYYKTKAVDESVKWWKKCLFITGGYWNKYFRCKGYGDANISRFYLRARDKSRVGNYVKKLKKIWDMEDIVFVEGEKSRLGVGNDLFDNAKSIRRILCPARNAFGKYDEILNKVKELTSEDDLIICALGPTATVLCFDLACSNRRAIDLGHIDIEYEWFRMGTTEGVSISGKDVGETNNEKRDDVIDINENVIYDLS